MKTNDVNNRYAITMTVVFVLLEVLHIHEAQSLLQPLEFYITLRLSNLYQLEAKDTQMPSVHF